MSEQFANGGYVTGDPIGQVGSGRTGSPDYVVPKAALASLDLERLNALIQKRHDHIAIISPDDRGRFRCGKWISKDPAITGWRVFVEDGGRRITLEAVSS